MNIEKEYDIGVNTSGLEGYLDKLMSSPDKVEKKVTLSVEGIEDIEKANEQIGALYEKTSAYEKEFNTVNAKLLKSINKNLIGLNKSQYETEKNKLNDIANKKYYNSSEEAAKEFISLFGKLKGMAEISGFKIKDSYALSDFAKDRAIVDAGYSFNKNVDKTKEYTSAFKNATKAATGLEKEVQNTFEKTTKISEVTDLYLRKLEDAYEELRSGDDNVAWHVGKLDSKTIRSSGFKKSDSLGDFWQSVMSGFGSSGGGDAYYLKNISEMAPTGGDVYDDRKYYALDYKKISQGALKFDDYDKFMKFHDASIEFQKYIAMLATKLDPSVFELDDVTDLSIYEKLKNVIPNFKMEFNEFQSFIEEMVSLFSQLGDIVPNDTWKYEFKNAPKELSNSSSTFERLMKSLGYTGVDVTAIPELDNYQEGSVIYDLDKDSPFVKRFDKYSEALRYEIDSISSEIKNFSAAPIVEVLEDVVEKSNKATKSISEMKDELAELGSSDFDIDLDAGKIEEADTKLDALVDDFEELAKTGKEVPMDEIVSSDINDKTLKERLEYLKELKKESKFMEDAEEKRLNMEDKGWDVGGNNPKSEADSQNKIRKYEELCEHIDSARASLDKFEEDYEEVIITMKNGDEHIVNYSSDLDDLSLALNRIKDIRFNERTVEYPFEDYFDSTDDNYERILKERQDSVLKENDSFVEDFKNDVEQVSKANDELREEIDEWDMLTREEDEPKHSGVGFDINHIPYTDVQAEQESLSSLLPTLERIQTAISEKNELFKEEATIVDQSVEHETTALLQLSLTISKIIQQLRELNNLDIKINIDISSVKGLVESLDKADYSNLLEVLKYGNELKNLAKILSESTKKINEAKRAVKETRPEVPDATLIKAYEDAENTLIYDRKRLADEKKLNEERKSGAKQTKEIEADIVKTVEKREELEKAISDRIESGKYTGKVVEEILNPLSKNVSQIDSSSMSFEEYKSAVTDAVAALKNFDKESQNNKNYLVAQNISVDKLNDRIQEFVNNNSKMGKANANAFKSIANGLEYGMSKADYDTALSNTIKLEAEIKRLKLTGKSTFELLSNRIKQMSVNFIAMYFSFYDMIRYGRQVVTTIKDMDTALTELRKVSDASDARLDQTFEKSAKTAKELGAAINDVINITADWSRLGYSVDQSEELARATTLMKNVSENITAEDASSYLISTLQGFNLEAENAVEIIDKYNNVANHMPISTAGIGEALQRSAASFRAANTDLSESIALVTTANSVLQNPEMVGGMYAHMRSNTQLLKVAISVKSQRWLRPSKDHTNNILCTN